MEEKEKGYRSGFVAIVGEPNVGKSTLMNALLGQKISIVTNKPQTTRQSVQGILSRDDAQIIFLDTPGLLKPKYLLHEAMLKHAVIALSEADIVLIMTETMRAFELPVEVSERVLPLCSQKPVLLIINKVDTINKLEVLPIIESFARYNVFKEIIPISALKGDNIDAVLQSLIRYLPEHEPFYPHDIISEQPERFFVAEIIREQLFKKLHKEVPYSTAVEIQEFRERKTNKILISASIIVERESQKGIIIGEKGKTLKEIGTSARLAIEKFLQHGVFLELQVKVREKWRENEEMLRRLGYQSRK